MTPRIVISFLRIGQVSSRRFQTNQRRFYADLYPNVELVSVTTSIDPSRPNPLEPYLDELQLPFPAIVDADLSLAGQLGASAFPFWVFTGPDGTTLLRIAGYLEVEQVAEIFSQLDGLTA